MREVLFVSKPVHPPWNDGSKNIVRDLTQNLSSWSASLLTTGRRNGVGRGAVQSPRRFAPSIADNVGVLLRLMTRRRPDLVHFVFAPNWRSSQAGRLVVRTRRLPSVHTAASAPRVVDSRLLFADRTVVLSRDTERRFLSAELPVSASNEFRPRSARSPRSIGTRRGRLLRFPARCPSFSSRGTSSPEGVRRRCLRWLSLSR